MRYSITLIVTLVLLATLTSCMERSEIEPSFKVVTASEQMSAATYERPEAKVFTPPLKEGETSARVKFYIKDVSFNEIVEESSEKNPIKQLGKAILETFARGIMLVGGNFELDLDPITYELPELDREMIKAIYINSIRFDVVDTVKGKSGVNLRFLEKMKVIGSSIVENKDLTLVHFDKDRDTCAGSDCVEIQTAKINMLDLIDEAGGITFTPSIKIGAAPSDKLVVDGMIDLVVVMKLPF